MNASALVQQTEEWLKFRKSMIGASDAPPIMGESPWKNVKQLLEEKLSTTVSTYKSDSMHRGIELEPIARELFTIKTGIKVEPDVCIHQKYPWMMASLDGISACRQFVVEIKCPKNPKDHQTAVSSHVPSHYYPQLQHQMEVCNVDHMFYFSFDGYDGVVVEVNKDQSYVEMLLEEEEKFYQCMNGNASLECLKSHVKEREDDIWKEYASQWICVSNQIKELEKQEKFLKDQLITLSGGSKSRGAGIRLCPIQRKGQIEYAKVPVLQGVDLEPYRKPDVTYWGITAE